MEVSCFTLRIPTSKAGSALVSPRASLEGEGARTVQRNEGTSQHVSTYSGFHLLPMPGTHGCVRRVLNRS